jgi:hypothetical protein
MQYTLTSLPFLSSFNVSSTDSKEPRFQTSPRWRQPAVRQAGRGLKTLIFRAQLTILKPLSVSERGWGEVHRTHVPLRREALNLAPQR